MTISPERLKIDQSSFQRTNGYIDIVPDKADSHMNPVLRIPIYEHDGSATELAAYIVRCVNSHEALLEAARAADEWSLNLHAHDPDDLCDKDCPASLIVAAIAAAEGV